MESPPGSVTVVLPCLNEAPALPAVLAAVPADWHALVVDNGSQDGSPELARRLGATVVVEPASGYGAAVHTGLVAAATELVVVLDCDGSVAAGDLTSMVDLVRSGSADLVCGRRRPVEPGAWPWHARAANALLARVIRSATGLPVHDIAPVRVARRDAVLALGLVDRRFGYPLEILLAVARAGWRVREVDVPYRRRAAGTRSKVTGSVRGTVRTVRDFGRVLRRARGDARRAVRAVA